MKHRQGKEKVSVLCLHLNFSQRTFSSIFQTTAHILQTPTIASSAVKISGLSRHCTYEDKQFYQCTYQCTVLGHLCQMIITCHSETEGPGIKSSLVLQTIRVQILIQHNVEDQASNACDGTSVAHAPNCFLTWLFLEEVSEADELNENATHISCTLQSTGFAVFHGKLAARQLQWCTVNKQSGPLDVYKILL